MRFRISTSAGYVKRRLKRAFLPGDAVRFQNRWFDIECVTESGYLLTSHCGNDNAFVLTEDEKLMEGETDIMLKFEKLYPEVCSSEISSNSIQHSPKADEELREYRTDPLELLLLIHASKSKNPRRNGIRPVK